MNGDGFGLRLVERSKVGRGEDEVGGEDESSSSSCSGEGGSRMFSAAICGDFVEGGVVKVRSDRAEGFGEMFVSVDMVVRVVEEGNPKDWK